MARLEFKHLDRFDDKGFIKVKAYEFMHCKDVGGDEVEEGEMLISIEGYSEACLTEFVIDLDISTAIKLHKTLRTEINKAKEVDNG